MDALEPCYYLRTLEWGALARTYQRPYSVWRQCGTEEDVEGGYGCREELLFAAERRDAGGLRQVYGDTGGPTDEARRRQGEHSTASASSSTFSETDRFVIR